MALSIVQEHARLKGAPLGYASFLVANVRLGYNKLHKMNTLAYWSDPCKRFVALSIDLEHACLKVALLGHTSATITNIRLGC